jgi:outer membrane immunogenic protein
VYFGGQVGSAAASYDGIYDSSDFNEVPPDSHIPAENLDDTGFTGAVYGGWNRQKGALVFGFEGDIGAADIAEDALEPEDGSEKTTADVGWLVSLRGRIGWGGPAVLVYGTGGVAYIQGDYDIRDVSDGNGGTDFDQVGFVLGGGIEWGAWKRVNLRSEVRYYFFGDKVDTSDLTGDSDPNDFIELKDVFMFTAGVTVHL